MRYSIGRALQLVGIVFVGFGLFVGLTRNDLKYEEKMLFAGGAVFVAGWLLDAEYVVDDGRRAFGGEALAPPLAAQPVEQFWLAAVAHAAPAKAHQRAAGRLVDAPQPDAAVGEAAVALGQRFGGALARDLLAVPEVPTHVGIGPQRVRDVEVGGGERPQPRAGGGEDRHGDQRPETGGAVTRQAAKKSTPRSASIPATAVVAAATRPETNSRNVGMANAAFSSTAIGISAR